MKSTVRCTIWPIFTFAADFFALLIAFKNSSEKRKPGLPKAKISNVTRASHLCWSENYTSYSWAKTGIFSANSGMFGIKRNLRNQAFYLCWRLGRQMTTVLSVSAKITSSCMTTWRDKRDIRFRLSFCTTLSSAQEIWEDFVMWRELLPGENVAR